MCSGVKFTVVCFGAKYTAWAWVPISAHPVQGCGNTCYVSETRQSSRFMSVITDGIATKDIVGHELSHTNSGTIEVCSSEFDRA